MKDDIQLTKVDIQERTWLKRIWGALPLICVVLFIVVLLSLIKSKNDFLEAKKKGLHILSGIKLATDRSDDLFNIIRNAKDIKEANEHLVKKMGMTKRQAQAISNMKLSSLTKSERAGIEKQIGLIQAEMAQNPEKSLTNQPEVNVVTMNLLPRMIRDRINLPGIIEPWIQLVILTEVKGKVVKKYVKEGDTVVKGDVIAVLDSRKYENNYQSAKALYESALASRKRLKELHKESLSTTSQLDNAVAQVENYKAVMDNAAQDLENCTIRSPISGIVNQVFIEIGQYLNASASVAEILQIDRLKVNVGIPESDVDEIRKIDSFDVKIDALQGKVFRGTAHYLSRSADPKARLYNLEIMIDNPEGKILPDMFARVEIIKKEVKDSIIIPLYSLIPFNHGHIVYVENGGRVVLKKVEFGLQEGWHVQITKGLELGEKLVVVGHRSVSDGQKVNVIRTIKKPEELTR